MTPAQRVLLAAALVCLAPLLAPRPANAQQAFTVQDIRIEGLRRISAGTIFNYLPVKVGEEIDADGTARAIRDLFGTGFFKDVRIERDGDTLVVVVEERPSIDGIAFSGNDSLETDDLLESLRKAGFAEGRIFNRAIFERMQQELRRTYFDRGRYAVKVKATMTPLPRNRVAVHFDIDEGQLARVQRINIVGNTVFSEKELLKDFSLRTRRWYTWFSRDDQYSKQTLSADLETLRSRYLDNGYINFSIDSTQVSITPDKRFVYVTINVTEGAKFTVRNVKVAGDVVLDKEQLIRGVTVEKGALFSRREVSKTSANLTALLGNGGYAFANVNAVPEIDEKEKKVDITFFTDPGKRVYVRRVVFRGNTKTHDEVLRREMRQLEGGWISTQALERSRLRLQRLGYFETVNVETPAVPGTADQVDVVVTVVERPSGNLIAGLGLSQAQGVVFQTSIAQENFMGTGNRVGFTFNNSDANRAFEFSFLDPYYTVDGVSRGLSAFFRETDAANANLASYLVNVAGASVDFGVPVNETDRVNLGLTVDRTEFDAQIGSSLEVQKFETDNPDGYLTWRLRSSWARDSRNGKVFATHGSLTRASAEIALPGSQLTYYRVGLRHQQFFSLGRFLTVVAEGKVNFGDGYGDTDELPLVNNVFAGGIRTVRGFRTNTLGPRDSNGAPLGGAMQVLGKGEVIVPVPFLRDSRAFRLTGFIDAGNVFKKIGDFDIGEVRVSTGVSAVWLSPFGAITASLAQPINDQDRDELERFQFTFGTNF